MEKLGEKSVIAECEKPWRLTYKGEFVGMFSNTNQCIKWINANRWTRDWEIRHDAE